MTDEKPWQFLLTQYGSNDPQRGMGWLPKRGVNVSQCEIARVFKLTNNLIEPISFLVPRKVRPPPPAPAPPPPCRRALIPPCPRARR